MIHSYDEPRLTWMDVNEHNDAIMIFKKQKLKVYMVQPKRAVLPLLMTLTTDAYINRT